jgi:hypothetical protein
MVVAPNEWAEQVKQLPRFYATQHLSSNHVHRINADEASCVSYMQAGHFMKWEDHDYACFPYGHYTNLLTRTDTCWKIRKCTLMVTASVGDARVFVWAFECCEGRGGDSMRLSLYGAGLYARAPLLSFSIAGVSNVSWPDLLPP